MTKIHVQLLNRATWIQMYGAPNQQIDAQLQFEAADTIRFTMILNFILAAIIFILAISLVVL